MRKVFFSFDWDDVWRVNQVRHSWVAKGSYENAGFIDDADIEAVKRSSDAAIKNWIDKQLNGTSVTCVLIGSYTAQSRWVSYEIIKSIAKGNGLVGIYIHNVLDQDKHTSSKGSSPLPDLLSYYSYYDWVNDNGRENLGDWIEKAAQQAGR